MNTYPLRSILLVAWILGVSTSSIYAIDIVTRKSEKNRIAGKVTTVTKAAIKIKPQSGPEVEIPANDIALIEWDGAPAQLGASLGQERNGAYEEAIKNLQAEMGKLPADADSLRTDFKFFIARILSKIALSDPARLPEAIIRLKKFTDDNSTSFRYYEALNLLGTLYLAQGDYAKADAAFSILEKSPFADYQVSAKSSKARVLLAQGKVDQALSAFDQVLKLPAKDESAQQRILEAKLGKATCLNKKSQPDKALKLLDEVIEKAKASDARLQAESQSLRGSALIAQGNNQEALLAFLLIDVLFSGQQDLHAEALYHLSKLWTTVGQPGRADEARDTLESKYPKSTWAQKLQ